ncbi:MAG: SPFH domain-containing protein [Deltaproteobacteria bacterium]
MALVEVVKYNGSPDVFAWKFPEEELGTWTQLIVNESQEAILFKGGQALDIFTAGRHTLETANIPILNKIINLPFGGRSPFTAEVWYINRAYSLDIKWGTPTAIQLQDPKYQIFVPVRSFGQFGIQIEDSRKFLIKLVGTLPLFDKENLIKYFRGLYLTKAKDSIASYLVNKQISILEINAHLEELSDFIMEKMVPVFSDFGIRLVNFFVNDINVPEDDPGVAKLKAALAKRAEMDIVGYNYVQERSFDTLEGAATNPGSGQAGIMGAGIGLGMGVGIGGNLGTQMGGITQNINTSASAKTCPKCNNVINANQRFCGGCGYDTDQIAATADTVIKCSKCGGEIAANAKFCPQCGDIYLPCPNCKADVPQGADVCPACGSAMPVPCPGCGVVIQTENAKFCPECGIALVRRCSKCNSEIQGEAKFCPDCGNKLE